MEANKAKLDPRLGLWIPLKFACRRSIFPAMPRYLLSSPLISARRTQLSSRQGVQPLQIEGDTDQTPLAPSRLLAAQGELPKAQHFLNDADHRLHRTFPQPVDRLAHRRFQLVGHLLLERSVVGGGAGAGAKYASQPW